MGVRAVGAGIIEAELAPVCLLCGGKGYGLGVWGHVGQITVPDCSVLGSHQRVLSMGYV